MKIHPTREWCERSAEIEGNSSVGAGCPPLIDYASLIAAYTALANEPLTPEGNPTFYALSQEAQDAIVWAAMSGDDEMPPKLSDSAQNEIRQWASSYNSKDKPSGIS